MHSELCPVCQGEGKIRDKLSGEKKTCHGCNGRGWVEVNDCRLHYVPFGDPPWPMYPPTYDPYYPNWTYKDGTSCQWRKDWAILC